MKILYHEEGKFMSQEQAREKKRIRYHPEIIFQRAQQHFYNGPAWLIDKIKIGSKGREPIFLSFAHRKYSTFEFKSLIDESKPVEVFINNVPQLTFDNFDEFLKEIVKDVVTVASGTPK